MMAFMFFSCIDWANGVQTPGITTDIPGKTPGAHGWVPPIWGPRAGFQVPVPDAGSDPPARGSDAPAARRTHFLHDFGELIDVLEAAVHGSEPDVRHLVQPLEFAHDQLAELLALDLALGRREQPVLDAPDRILDRFARHRALAQRQQHRCTQLVAVVFGAAATALDDRRQGKLHALVGGKALVAFQATPAAPDGGAFVRGARIDDLGIGVGAERAFHE